MIHTCNLVSSSYYIKATTQNDTFALFNALFLVSGLPSCCPTPHNAAKRRPPPSSPPPHANAKVHLLLAMLLSCRAVAPATATPCTHCYGSNTTANEHVTILPMQKNVFELIHVLRRKSASSFGQSKRKVTAEREALNIFQWPRPLVKNSVKSCPARSKKCRHLHMHNSVAFATTIITQIPEPTGGPPS